MGATNGDATPRPRLKADSVRIMSKSGIVLYAARTGWRYFVTGREIRGMGDNATFLHDATMDHGYPLARPYAKLTRARWRRVARRWALLGVPLSLVSAEASADGMEALCHLFGLTAPGWTEVPYDSILTGYGSVGMVAGAVIVTPKIKHAIEDARPNREYVYPAVQVACKILGTKYTKRDAPRMLDLPKGWGVGRDGDQYDIGAVMPRLYLPAVPLDANTKKRIVANVGARLGIPNPEGVWQEVGGRAHVTFNAFPMPPATVKPEQVRRAIQAADLTHPNMGFAKGGEPIGLDYDEESPHLLISGGSGSGKSTLVRHVLSQRMAKGNGLIVLDFKRMSHPWATDMPRDRALYFYKIAEIHDALVQIDVELTHRMHGPAELVGTHRPVDILIEELNSTVAMLRSYWRERRAEIKRENALALKEDPYADVVEPPLQSPAIQAIANVTNLGRQVMMFAHVAGQRVSANALGANGGDTRESFQSRAIAKWTRKTWTMLTDVPFIACPSGPRGIWALVQGDRVSIVRVPLVSDADARTLALSGPEPTEPILSSVSGHGRRTIEGETVRTAPVQAVRPDKIVSLSDAADTVGLSVKALRVARDRGGDFPAPVEIGGPGKADRFSLLALVQWRERRDGIRLELPPDAASEG